jgi:hypothetical protein
VDSFLITLLVLAIAAVSNWLQKRAQSEEQSRPKPRIPPRPLSPPPGRRPTQAPPTAPRPTLESTIERELKRLLGEELPPEAPVAPPPLTPGVHRIPQAPPPHLSPSGGRQLTKDVAPPPLSQPASVVATAAVLPTALASYGRAQQLHESVAERLRQVEQQTRHHGVRAALPPAGAAPAAPSLLRHLARNPAAARQAFIGSLIWGPPKGLEP